MKNHQWISTVLLILVAFSLNQLNAQAEFSGNVKNIVSKKGVNNVQIMVVTETDTVYHKPDIDGNFNFSNKAGKTKIYAVSEGFVSEINSVNTTNGSKNKVNIAMVPTSKYDASSAKRATWDMNNKSSYAVMEKMVKREACAIPGIKPVSQSLGGLGSGILTASEINDFARWKFAGDLSAQSFINDKMSWGFVLDTRIPVQFTIDGKTPLIDADIRLVNTLGVVLWSARTDNTGKAELWPVAFKNNAIDLSNLTVDVSYGDEIFTFDLNTNDSGLQSFSIQRPCSISDNLDIAFVVDATGSMGDEIGFIKNDLDTFIKQVAHENKDINIRLGGVFYRDMADEYVARFSPFSSNSSVTDNFILDQTAAGGGDYPEAVTTALQVACDSLEWSENARARILFLILDAGAHEDSMSKADLRKYTAVAASKGIRIVPIICSGLTGRDASLMRAMALATNGTNIFLKNYNNGVNQHLEASGDHYKIETLSELMNRITRQFSVVPECDNKINQATVNITDSLLYTLNPNGEQDTAFLHMLQAEWQHQVDTLSFDSGNVITRGNVVHLFVTVFPNPTQDWITIKTSADIKMMYLADVTGKVLQQINLNREGLTKVNLSPYSSGIYYLKYPTRRGWGAERVLLQRN